MSSTAPTTSTPTPTTASVTPPKPTDVPQTYSNALDANLGPSTDETAGLQYTASASDCHNAGFTHCIGDDPVNPPTQTGGGGSGQGGGDGGGGTPPEDEYLGDDNQNSCAAGGQSFTADTEVLMADGSTKPISQIRPGDKVQATDPTTGTTAPQTVTDVWVNHDSDLLDLTIQTGDTQTVIHTTEHHAIWDDTTHTWTDANHLHPGDHLHTDTGTEATVTATVILPGSGDMWDLTITNTHTFYVVVVGASILVHNVNGECPNPIGELGVSGRASYSRLQAALNRVTSRTAPEVRESLSPEQIAAGRARPYLQRMFYGSSVENAVAADPAVLADENIAHLGSSMPGQPVPDFNIAGPDRAFGVDITGPSRTAWLEHLGRFYIESPYQILTYDAPTGDFLAEVFG